MQSIGLNTPLGILQKIEQEAIELSKQGILQTIAQGVTAKMVAFQVNQLRLFCEVDNILQVAESPAVVTVPQTKPWIRGIANLKGEMYSVCDLSLFAGFKMRIARGKGNLILINHPDAHVALLVDKVIGFRYFDEKDITQEQLEQVDELGEFMTHVDKVYDVDGYKWCKLNINHLMNSVRFLEVQ